MIPPLDRDVIHVAFPRNHLWQLFEWGFVSVNSVNRRLTIETPPDSLGQSGFLW
jgi:hypothetical protein